MSFAEVVDRQQDAVFRRLGEDATWSGVSGSVRIRCAERDDLDGWGDGQRVVRTRFVRVRRSQVPTPGIGDTITRAADGVVLEVLAKPRLTRTRIWTCEVKEIPA